jgi:hypothetical protein
LNQHLKVGLVLLLLAGVVFGLAGLYFSEFILLLLLVGIVFVGYGAWRPLSKRKMDGNERLLWGQLDRAQRISSVLGLIAGISGLTASLGLGEILLFLLVIGPCLALLAGGLGLLMISMSQDNRGILGFVVFVGSVVILTFILAGLAYLTPPPPT